MVARDWGRIIFIASDSALIVPPDMIHYGMTKTAQLAIARGLSASTKGTRVTVNSVLPGTMDTPANRAAMPDADPKTWTRPYTVRLPLRLQPDYQAFEYACHEGNYSMRNILAGERAAEKAAEASAPSRQP